MLKTPTLRTEWNLSHVGADDLQEVREHIDETNWYIVPYVPGVMIVLDFNDQYHFAEEFSSVDIGFNPDTLAYLKSGSDYPHAVLWWGDFPKYGVVDSPEQFVEMFAENLQLLDDVFFVTLVEVRRQDEPLTGGWRYHKWGQYYGNQNPQHEYLVDDLHIHSVWCFHVHRYK